MEAQVVVSMRVKVARVELSWQKNDRRRQGVSSTSNSLRALCEYVISCCSDIEELDSIEDRYF